jgi:hypothetical protein
MLDRAIGVGEAGLTAITGATGGTIGAIGGTLKGLAEQILSGQFGTREAVELVAQSASEGAQALTYQPRTQSGQEAAQALGEAASMLPPVVAGTLPLIPAGMASQTARTAQGMAAAGAAQTLQRARTAAAPAVQRVQQVAQRATDAVRPVESSFGRGSVSAAEASQAAVRRETAAQMPAPFTDEFALTKGMESRNFEQLQFEKEVQKQPELGAPMRERQEKVVSRLFQNFDALVDKAGPIRVDERDIGRAVNAAVVNKANVAKKRIKTAYAEAREAGELNAPVELSALAVTLTDLDRFAGVTPTIAPIRKEALRLGALVEDESGGLRPQPIKLDDAELLRQFVNQVTDGSDPRLARAAKIINASIDEATEGQGGDLYRKARALRRQYAQEFENVGLTKKLLGTKGKTDERQIAFEDVFQRIMIDSPVEEMNKLRRTLITAGPEGKQAWQDLKGKTISYIKERAENRNALDSQGRPTLSNAKLNQVITALDREGKLEALYGKRQAQTIRDLGDLAMAINTAPPGAINTSNTASAIIAFLGDIGLTASTGLPAPVLTGLKTANQYVKDKRVRARVEDALNKAQKQKPKATVKQ